MTVQSVDTQLTCIPLTDFKFNHENLVACNNGPINLMVSKTPLYTHLAYTLFEDQCHEYAACIPNQHCQIDNGDDLFTIWMPILANDVSRAQSKQYQKHINVYMANANLPRWLLQQEYFVKFVSTSPHAGSLEQLRAVVDQVK
jgi:hypothetical protein